ncbi:MAG: hypothetical protein R6V19_04495, partial [Armatimonadota bacterium]
PGEMTGTRQHGMTDVQMAALIADTPTLAAAREDARKLLETDPDLKLPRHDALRETVTRAEKEQEAGLTI